MANRLLRLSLVAALLCGAGAQWAILQSAAWAGMTASRLQDRGLHQAVSSTFDGKHPCRVCLGVQKGAQSQKKQESDSPQSRLDIICSKTAMPEAAFRPLWNVASLTKVLSATTPPYDAPPPRSLPA